MDLSVIIVNYNVRFFIEQCIISLQRASENLNVEIIVIDNNSNDDSCKIIEEKYKDVILIRNEENQSNIDVYDYCDKMMKDLSHYDKRIDGKNQKNNEKSMRYSNKQNK